MAMRVLQLLLLAATALAASAAGGGLDTDGLLEKARELEPWLVDTRRVFHQYPELMFEVGARPWIRYLITKCPLQIAAAL